MKITAWQVENSRLVELGDRVKITELRKNTEDPNSPFRREIKGRVFYIHPQYIVVDNGHYCEAFNKIDFQTGTLKIEVYRKR